MRRLTLHVLLGLGLTLFFACADDAEQRSPADPDVDRSLGTSPGARPEILETLRDVLAAPRHPADGGGRAWIESVENAAGDRVALRAGGRARIRLVYEAGPLGIAKGGALAFQLSPFWEWDPPQPRDRDGPGYTEMSAALDDLNPQLFWDGERLFLEFRDRPLPAGGRVHLTYGAGPALARVDRFAEREARLWFAVDGDGDGIRAFIDDPPSVDIAAGSPARLFVVLPATARPGEDVTLRVSILDQHGSAGSDFSGEVRLDAPEGLELPATLSFAAEHRGQRSVVARASAPGIFRITASSDAVAGALRATSNPLVVEAHGRPLFWADLHGHSQLSDGTGTPEDYFRYARDVAGLDIVALTDHDHWGLRGLDDRPEAWERIRSSVARFHEPGRFVTLLGYEWTSPLHGHRHVLYFEDDGEVLSFLDPRYQTPAQLWAALRGQPALTFAHHSAGGPIATNWSYRPDPELEPVTEIVSVHGSSEAPDSPWPIYRPVAGNFVRDVLDEGLRFGFIGSGDSHDGHPGTAHLDSTQGGGLAAIRSHDLSRAGVRAALKARRVYATNGARIFLDVSLDGAPMGSVIETPRDAASPAPEAILRIRVVAETPLERVDLVGPDGITALPLDGPLEWSAERPIARLRPGDYYYVRVVQRDGGAAWSSPFYAE